jgi:hypothetical protein
MFQQKNEALALIGDRSFTLLLSINVARQLGVGNREVLKYRVDGDRLIVEKYHNSVTGRITVMEEH